MFGRDAAIWDQAQCTEARRGRGGRARDGESQRAPGGLPDRPDEEGDEPRPLEVGPDVFRVDADGLDEVLKEMTAQPVAVQGTGHPSFIAGSPTKWT